MRRVLAATAALVLFSFAGPDVPRARAGPDFCRLYCESVAVGCKVTIGKIDEEYCEKWREGCKDGCEITTE